MTKLTPTLTACAALIVLGVGLTPLANAAVTVLDFEAPFTSGLTPMSYWQGSDVPLNARVTDQYLDSGVMISNAALVNLGLGHAASGTNGLGGIDANGRLDYDAPVTFSFYLPGNVNATTDYFAYSPDLGGWSGNTITLSAYGIDGLLVGQTSYVETGVFSLDTPLAIQGFGQFHRITIDQTLYNQWSGGIGIDLVRYGDLVSPVPEPEAYAMLLAGLGLLGFTARRRKNIAS